MSVLVLCPILFTLLQRRSGKVWGKDKLLPCYESLGENMVNMDIIKVFKIMHKEFFFSLSNDVTT